MRGCLICQRASHAFDCRDNFRIFQYFSGDSGGAVFLYNRAKAKAICLYGVTSYGASDIPCGDPDIPSVSVRAHFYLHDKTATKLFTGAKINDKLNFQKQTKPKSPLVILLLMHVCIHFKCI